MIERLNFYDLYGYLLPGLILLVLFWIPYGVAYDDWPASALSSALLIALIGYLAGHLVQMYAQIKYSSSFEYTAKIDNAHVKVELYPSDALLDDRHLVTPKFSGATLKLLSELIAKHFGITVRQQTTVFGDAEEAIENEKYLRRESYFRCRDYLIEAGGASYAQQFHGLYSLMQGLTAAFSWAGYHLLGWFVGLTVVLLAFIVGFFDPAWVSKVVNTISSFFESPLIAVLVRLLVASIAVFVFAQLALKLYRRSVGMATKASEGAKNKSGGPVNDLGAIAAGAAIIVGSILSANLAMSKFAESKTDDSTQVAAKLATLFAPAMIFAAGAPFCWICSRLFHGKIKYFAEQHARAVFVSFLNRAIREDSKATT